jgi:CRISPR-associated protein Cas5d
VATGRCCFTPYLGCREFSGYFMEPEGTEKPLDLDDDLGMMLFDLRYEEGKTGRGKPIFFHSRLSRGVLQVPPELYREEGETCSFND